MVDEISCRDRNEKRGVDDHHDVAERLPRHGCNRMMILFSSICSSSTNAHSSVRQPNALIPLMGKHVVMRKILILLRVYATYVDLCHNTI